MSCLRMIGQLEGVKQIEISLCLELEGETEEGESVRLSYQLSKIIGSSSLMEQYRLFSGCSPGILPFVQETINFQEQEQEMIESDPSPHMLHSNSSSMNLSSSAFEQSFQQPPIGTREAPLQFSTNFQMIQSQPEYQYLQYSGQQEPNSVSVDQTGPAPSKVLLVTIQNPRDEVIQHKVIFNRFSIYGEVEQILIFSKKQQWKFFVDMDSIESSTRAMVALDSTYLEISKTDQLRMRVQYSNQPILHLKNGNPGGINYKELNSKFENTNLSYSHSYDHQAAYARNTFGQQKLSTSRLTSHSAQLPQGLRGINVYASGNITTETQQQIPSRGNNEFSAPQSTENSRKRQLSTSKIRGNSAHIQRELQHENSANRSIHSNEFIDRRQGSRNLNSDISEDDLIIDLVNKQQTQLTNTVEQQEQQVEGSKNVVKKSIFASAEVNQINQLQSSSSGNRVDLKTRNPKLFNSQKNEKNNYASKQPGLQILDRFLGTKVEADDSFEEQDDLPVSEDEGREYDEDYEERQAVDSNTQKINKLSFLDEYQSEERKQPKKSLFSNEDQVNNSSLGFGGFPRSVFVDSVPQQQQDLYEFSNKPATSYSVTLSNRIPSSVSSLKTISGGSGQLKQENMGQFSGSTYVKQGFLEDSRPSKVIYVNHLSNPDIQISYLYNVFSNFGDIVRMLLKRHKNTAFIEYSTQEYATRAKDYMDKKVFFEAEIRVFYSHFDTILPQQQQQQLGQSDDDDLDSTYFEGSQTTNRFAKEAKMTLNSPSLVVHISNLKQEVCDHEKMLELFQPFGKIDAIHIEKVPPRYMCHIKFQTIKEALMAVAYMHNKEVKGRKMFLSFTRKKLDSSSPQPSRNITYAQKD